MEKEPGFEAGADHRLAEPFEEIRARTTRHAKATGRYPRVLLLKRGDLKMRMARANFSLNFFGCAGFDIEEAEQLEGKQPDLIVLCSSDPEYPDFAREICAVATAPVIVAGYPKDQIETLQAAGVKGFIHIQSDAVRTLTEWQDRLGMQQ
jgi:methylmalonyl-CoA mutase